MAKTQSCRLNVVIPGFDCAKCRIDKRMTEAEKKRAHELFDNGHGLTIEEIGIELGKRPTSIAYLLLPRPIAVSYHAFWDIAIQQAFSKCQRHRLDANNAILKEAIGLARAFPSGS
jgi:hypothetical protein